jgi:hypothetical protein
MINKLKVSIAHVASLTLLLLTISIAVAGQKNHSKFIITWQCRIRVHTFLK